MMNRLDKSVERMKKTSGSQIHIGIYLNVFFSV